MTFENDSNTAKSEPSKITTGTAWPKDVLIDIAHAMRRDGFYQTAELVDDALITLDMEFQRKRLETQELLNEGTHASLKVVK